MELRFCGAAVWLPGLKLTHREMQMGSERPKGAAVCVCVETHTCVHTSTGKGGTQGIW